MSDTPVNFDTWLKSKGIPDKYHDVFSWGDGEIRTEYDKQFDIMDAHNQRVKKLQELFEKTHQERLQYMQAHSIKSWAGKGLGSEHITKNESFQGTIEKCVTELKELGGRYGVQEGGVTDEWKFGLRHPMKGIIVSIALLAGIMDRSYPDAETLLCEFKDDSEIKRSIRIGDQWRSPTQFQQQIMDAFGPVYNEKWRMYPRLNKC